MLLTIKYHTFEIVKKEKLRQGILLSLLLLITSFAFSQQFMPGISYYGKNNYVEYVAGNLPLIISVPHGGSVTPSDIPDRTCGDETVTDSYTTNLAKEIKDAIFKITGCYPHIILNNLKRTKMDANRDLPEAACGNVSAGQAWTEYQSFIDSAAGNIKKKSGKGLFIDLHGHGHAIQRLEIGYLLTAAQLKYTDAVLNTPVNVALNSIRNLINSNVSNFTHAELLRGPYSLGAMFTAKGYPSVPSTDDPYPLTGQTYFTGGYNTDRHGSGTSGTIDGIQIECNQDVRFVESARLEFASKVAVIFLDYLIKHYFPKLPQTYCLAVGVEQMNLSKLMVYPNPFNNILCIHNLTPSEFAVYDLQGKMVFSKCIDADEKVDLGHLKNGIYLVTLKINGKVSYAEKIIKER